MTRDIRDNGGDPQEAALNWLIALRESPDEPGLRARFGAWLSESERHAAAWREAQGVWDLLGEAQSRRPAVPETRARRPCGRGRHPGRRSPRVPVRIAAGAALAAALVLFVLPAVSLYLEADTMTGVGEMRMVALADDSRLVLGAESAVEIVYSRSARRIRLLSGTVFVDVVPDSARPFTVVADGLDVTAVGTAYEVGRRARGTFVAVERGAVSANRADSGVAERLGAGDRISLDAFGAVVGRGAGASRQVAAWRDNRLNVTDWPLGDVAEALRAYFHGVIVIADGDTAGRRVSGIYDLTDPEKALRAAAYPHGLTVRRVTPWILVLSRR